MSERDLTPEEEAQRDFFLFAQGYYWKMISDKVEQMIECIYSQMETCAPEELRSLQGEIRMARKLIGIVEDPAQQWAEKQGEMRD